MIIRSIKSKKIKDSRGDLTIQVSVNGSYSSSPSGKSTGKYETPPYHKSIEWNISKLNSLNELIGLEINSFEDLKKVEKIISKKFKLNSAKLFGANALFALESAILKSLAHSEKKELWQILNPNSKNFPRPVGNVIGGGLHTRTKNHPIFQEFLLIPNEKNFSSNVNKMKSIHAKLKKVLKSFKLNDEGAIITTLNNEQVLELISKQKIPFGIDVAASAFYNKKEYCYSNKNLDRKSQIFYINTIIKDYSPLYLEDPLEENDFIGFSKLTKKNLIVGDDLTVSHSSRTKLALKKKSINAIIIKPNQNGSLLEISELFKFCKENKIKTIISHRSGETLDSALADFAFGFQADFIKCGIATKWRDAKLNRLIEIERTINSQTKGLNTLQNSRF